ncbi:MAG: hypothetical protein ABFC63_06285 [Thermoguttaceae bacterium]
MLTHPISGKQIHVQGTDTADAVGGIVEPGEAASGCHAMGRPLPKDTIFLAAAVTLAAVALTTAHLGFRNSRADLLNPKSEYRLSNSTANAVFINSLGNMMGFGSLMIANHQGLQSLGRVLTIGMACCLASALALPSFLILIDRCCKKRSSPDGDNKPWDAASDGIPMRPKRTAEPGRNTPAQHHATATARR